MSWAVIDDATGKPLATTFDTKKKAEDFARAARFYVARVSVWEVY